MKRPFWRKGAAVGLALFGLVTFSPAETLYIVGNSLASIPPTLDWYNTWGMAASFPHLDYAHLLQAKLEAATGKKFEIVIQRSQNEAALGGLPEKMPESADVVILQLGDNYKNKLEHAEAVRRYSAMLSGLKKAYPNAKIVSVSPYKCAGTEIMRESAQQENVPFADISPLRGNPALSAKGYKAWAVNWHPGNRAMELIADTIWEALSPQIMPERLQANLTGIVPEVQEISLRKEMEFQLVSDMTFHAPANASEPLRFLLDELADEFRTRFAITPKIACDLPANSRLITLEGKDKLNTDGISVPDQGFDGYALRTTSNGVAIMAAPQGEGLYYGLQTLRQMLDGRGCAPAADVRDWADQEWRIAYMGLADPEFICSKLARLKINMVIVESYWNGHQNWWFRATGTYLAMAQKFCATAKKYNLEVVPLVQGGGWAYGIVDHDPHLAEGIWVQDETAEIVDGEVTLAHANVITNAAQPIIIRSEDGKTTYQENKDYQIVPGVTVRRFEEKNKPWKFRILEGGALKNGMKVVLDYNYVPLSPHQSPYCPSDPETYQYLDTVLTNVVNIFHPRFIHIGHDEVIRRNTDRRCQERGLSRVELAAEDLNWWYQKLKSLDPNIRIMVWDDMFRKDAEEKDFWARILPWTQEDVLLDRIPEDVIICPWVYGADANAQQEIGKRAAWFLGEKDRLTIGTISGYHLENALLWHEAMAEYTGQKNNLGLMFTHWGESMWLWASLPYTADYMWSGKRPNAEQMKIMMAADENLKTLAIRPPLDVSLQTANFADRINRGENDLAKMRNALLQAEITLEKMRMPGFSGTDNPLKESVLGQGRRVVKTYEAMTLARELPITRDPNGAKRFFGLLDELYPARVKEWDAARTVFDAQGKLPDTRSIFGIDVEIVPALNREGGLTLPVEPAKVTETSGAVDVDFGRVLPLYRVNFSQLPAGEFLLLGGADPEHLTRLAEFGGGGSAAVSFDPADVRCLKVEKKGDAQAKFTFQAIYSVFLKNRSYNPELTEADNFVTKNGTLAKLRTQASMRCSDDRISVTFEVEEKPENPPKVRGGAIYEDDCVQLFIREKAGSDRFLQVIVNCEGNVSVKAQNGREGKLPACTAKVTPLKNGSWKAEIAIPMADMQGKPEEWAVNFTRTSLNDGNSSYAFLPKEASYWFLQPQVFVGMQK